MTDKTEIKRVALPSNELFHPVEGTNDIFTVVGNSRNQLQSDYINGAQVMWFTISANHLASSATSFTDFNDDTDSQMMKMLFFFLLQMANTFSVEVDEPVNADDQPRGENATLMTKKVQKPLARFLPRLQGEPAHPSRKIFVEQLFADSDPEQKIGYRFAFCLYSDECGWANLAYEAASVNERRFRRRAPRFEELAANPNFEVTSLDRLASLYCYYLGNPKGGYRKMSAALWNVATANEPDNDAYPPSVFSFENSCNNLARFSNNETTVQLSMLDDTEHVLDIQSQPGRYYTLESQGGRSRRLNLTFPIPDAVWEIDSPYWSHRALEGILLPGFETSEMEKLANSMRDERISVNNASGRLDTDMAREILNMSMNTAGGVEGAEEVSMAVLHDNDELPATAVFGEHSRIDIASMSSSEQFRLTSAIVRLRDENGPVVQETKRANYTKKQFDKRYKSYRKKTVKSFTRDVMTRNNKRLSGPERSVVNHFLTYVKKRKGKSFVPEEFTMPFTDESLTPAANYIKALMDEKEANGMSTFHVPDLILWTGLNDSWRYGTGLHINFALTGKHGAGKSYLQNRIKKRCVKGVCAEATHETAKAAMTAGNRNGEINVIEELPPWMFGNSDGQGVETGDPTLKARLTQAIISVVYFHYDKETGERQRKVIYAMAMTTTCAATNEEWYQMPAALRNRFWHITAPVYKRVGLTPADRITIGRIASETTDYGSEIEFERSQFEQCLIAITEWLIATRCICIMTNGVNMELFHQMSEHHYAAMKSIGIETGDVRVRERVLYFARTLTIRMAIHWLCFTPLSKYRLTKGFDLHQFAIDIEEQLVCTEEIVNFAFELSASQFINPNIAPVVESFASLAKYNPSRIIGHSQYSTETATNSNMVGSASARGSVTRIQASPEEPNWATVARRGTDDDVSSQEEKDYNYIQIRHDIKTIADDIANETKQTDLTLAPADIRTILRELTHIRVKAYPRTSPQAPPDLPEDDEDEDDNGGEGSSTAVSRPHRRKQLYPAVVIDSFNNCVKIHCSFIDQIKESIGHNLIEEKVIRPYRHPKQTPYDTVSITAFKGYPNLLPRICVRPNTEEEYAQGPKYLTSYNPNVLSEEYRLSRGFGHENPTPFTVYRDIHQRIHTKWDRLAPGDEIAAWHLTMTGHDPTNKAMLRAFPQGRQAYMRIYKYAELLYKLDVKAEREAEALENVTYTRKYPTLKNALKKAQEMEYEGSIKLTPSYPLKQIVDRTQEIVDIIVQRSENPKRDLAIAKSRFTVAYLGCGFWDTATADQKAYTKEISFNPNQSMERIEQVSSFAAALPIEGSGAFKRPMEPETQIVCSTSTYAGLIPKRRHLLTEAVHDEIQYQNEMSAEQNRRRLEARERMEALRQQQPEIVQEMSAQALLDNFRERVQPNDEPVEQDIPPVADMSMQELMGQQTGMQVL
jgi:hypothetical protein